MTSRPAHRTRPARAVPASPRALAAAALLTALSLAGCADPAEDEVGAPAAAGSAPAAAEDFDLGPDQDRITTEEVPGIAALVPAEIRERGTLEVAQTGNTAPPLNFYATDNETVIGVETDIASLVADVLGLEVHYNTMDWANIFVGLDSGRYDVGFSNITVTEERKEKYDFATYRLDNLAVEAPAGGDWRVREPADVAGHTLGVGSGTNQEQILLDWNEENLAHGLEPCEIKYYQNAADYYLALSSGRIDAYFGPHPTAAYHSAVTGETEIIGTFSGGGDEVQGEIAATTKKDNGLVRALNEALNEVIGNGTYAQVLDRWGLSDEAVERSEINPPGLPPTE